MKKHNSLTGSTKDSVKKYYILTRPSRLSDLTLDELEDDSPEYGWREKSRQLQARRWRKIRHQLA
jgi:hypothetical protein